MKNQKAISSVITLLFLSMFLTVLAAPARADWQKMYPAPDVDKAEHKHWAHATCWVASAADMLAGAGYGDGKNAQERADDIYTEMCTDPNITAVKCCCPAFDSNCYGWADTALRAWLRSENNKWKQTNPYKIVTLHGAPNCKEKGNRYPWANPVLPEFVGNELRKCNMLRLSIRKPTCGASVGRGGHAITAWGDSGGGGYLTDNPNKVKVSDSDYKNITQDVQTYTYDDYNNPNPDGCNEGNGWYIDYGSGPHWYIDNVVTLSPTKYTGYNLAVTKRYVGSYKIHQDKSDANALGLHYKVKSGTIYSYRSTIDWDNNDVPPNIIENNSPPTELAVNWDLYDNPVPHCNDVTITTEVVLPWEWGMQIFNPITYADVNFTYVDLAIGKPKFGWQMTTNKVVTPGEPNATGGYVIGAFDIFDAPTAPVPVAQYRLICEYGYDQDPEHHEFFLEGPEEQADYCVGNFRFGHSYAFLDDSLWQFEQWWTYETERYPIWPPGSIPPVNIDWTGMGLLPYPKAQDYTTAVPEKCGDPGTWYVSGDINRDCYVDFKDFAEFAGTWLQCTDPCDANCW